MRTKATLMLGVIVAAVFVNSAAEARWFGVGGWRGGIGWGRGVGWRGVGWGYGVRRYWRPAVAVGAGIAAASYYRNTVGYGGYGGYSAPACTCPNAGYGYGGYGYGW